MDSRRYIKVIIPVKFRGTVTYALPEGVVAGPGEWVSVRFGAKTYTGVIAETVDEADIPDSRIREISSVERLPPVSLREIRLWKQVAEYYMCTIGEVFKCAYPERKVAREGKRLSDKEAAERRILKLARETEEKLDREFSRIEEKIAKELAKPGTAKKGLTEDSLRDGFYRTSRILKKYIENGTFPLTPDTAGKRPDKACIQALGLKIAEKIISARKPWDEPAEAMSGEENSRNGKTRTEGPLTEKGRQWKSPVLSEAQEKAKAEILKNFSKGKRVLLKGVAGSGKTEIYASIAADILKNGKSVLMLVPEISLSRQLEERMRSFFGDRTVVYHSKETTAKRDGISARLRNGENLFVLGTRSALFLPCPDIGYIIVDEENDSSYKQTEPAPRYNGRDAAMFLSSITGAPLLLGSATPSYESIYNVLAGKLAEVSIDEKYHKGGKISTVLIDTIAERRKRGMDGPISKKLIGMMQDTLNRNGQIMLFRARRAYSPVLQCRECGEMPKCPHCNAYLSYHKEEGYLECHYCGSRFGYTGICPKCGGTLEGRGAGTEKIEEEINRLFPSAKTARLDSDTARNPAQEKMILKDFSEGKTDILVGTQIIAKGFDFGNVSLVAILNADSLIGLQDFRADENALQLLMQLKGRCARRENDGTFVIQTEQPGHPVYSRLLLHTRPEEGMKERETFDYPPFTRMVEIVMRSRDKARLKESAGKLYEALSQDIPGHIGIPVEPQINMISGKHILIIRIRLKRDRKLSESKRKIWDTADRLLKNESGTEYYFNVDPL